MIARIKNLITIINRFTQGDYDIYIDGIDGKDELSKMAKAIYHFKQDSLEMRRNAEALEAEQQRRKDIQDEVVGELRDGLARLSEGNLSCQFTEEFPDEYEGLRQDFNTTIAQLNTTMTNISKACANIRSSSSELTHSSEELSERTTNQAATLEETAAALEEMTSSVRKAAEGATDVRQTTGTAKTDATKSGEVVKQAVSAMSEISDSSNQIAQIIGVIDDIAFQTNLLALNAGVEAARAGEAGSGFAVVASEVRALAQRSSDAALEIKGLIQESSQHVSSGVELVNQTGDALGGIVDQVSHISSLVAEMAHGFAEQASGLGEINTGVSQLDGVTQQNAAMVHQVNTTCGSLKDDTQELDRLVAQFVLAEGHAAPRGAEKRVA